jgi:hypothetical protein
VQYIVTRNFYEGNGLHEEGQAFEHQDQAYIEKCLADGNIAPVTEGGSESTTPLVPAQPASDSQNPPQISETPQGVAPISEPQPPIVPSPSLPPQELQQPQAPQQPTQEEIAATLAASEGSSQNSVDIQ